MEPEGVNAGSAEGIEEEQETRAEAMDRVHEDAQPSPGAEPGADTGPGPDADRSAMETEAQPPGPSGAMGPPGPGQELSAGEG